MRPREAATVLILLLVVAVVGTLVVAVAIPALRAGTGPGGPGSSAAAPSLALPSIRLPGVEVPSLPVGTPTGTPDPEAVLLAAGDIASCNLEGDSATANLLDGLPGTIAALGDSVYESGAPSEYADCYEPTWGRHRERTRPAVGDHEYRTEGAAGYFGYFGSAAGTAGEGWYSYELGEWHLIALNSNCARISCGEESPQLQWLEADLAASNARCTLAYWHHPRFSSGAHGSTSSVQSLWKALWDGGAEIVLSGHDHDYERLAPLDAQGSPDPERGMRQFVVGTGGASLRGFGLFPAGGSEARQAGTHGVLQLTLGEGRYEWRFVPVEGSSFTDSGSGSCH